MIGRFTRLFFIIDAKTWAVFAEGNSVVPEFFDTDRRAELR